MSTSHLFAVCSEALCIAEDTAVALYSTQTLAKFRVERLNGFRIAGIYVQEKGPKQSLLHVVDVVGTWFVLNLQTLSLEHSSSVEWCRAAKDAPQVHRCHFHEARGVLHAVVVVIADGVYECVLARGQPSRAERVAALEGDAAASAVVTAVGRSTGLLILARRGQRWLHYSTHAERLRAAQEGAGGLAPQHRRGLGSVTVCSVACSGVDDGVAVGGERGELLVFPSIGDSHFFSDHWHHTPLEALAFSADGLSLYTGAAESVLLVWNLTTFTHRKVSCNSGPVHTVVASSLLSPAPSVLLACNRSTLVSVDATQLRVARTVDGIEWSANAPATGLVVDEWMGRPAVVVLGLPNVLRICDPLTQQALYSLHTSSTMETIPQAPASGIRFAGILHDGRTLVTYEEFGTPALPPLLRLWRYDSRRQRHTEVQAIYEPHESAVLALRVDKEGGRVVTMSRDVLKCWEEMEESATDALRTTATGWRNHSSSRTPSSRVSGLALSQDGSLCFVSDDSVHVYGLQDCAPGLPWPCLGVFTQSVTLDALSAAIVLPGSAALAALSPGHVHLWDLARCGPAARTYAAPAGARLTAVCKFSSSSVLVADAAGVLTEVDASGAVKGSAAAPSKGGQPAASCVRFMERLPGYSDRVAVIDSVSGFRVVSVAMQKRQAVVSSMADDEAAATVQQQQRQEAALAGKKPYSFAEFFRTRDESGSAAAAQGGGFATTAQQSQADTLHTQQANKWALDVLGEPAYTLPRMSNVLGSYLKKVNGLGNAD